MLDNLGREHWLPTGKVEGRQARAHGFASLNARLNPSGVIERCSSWRAKHSFLQPPSGRGASVTATGLGTGFLAVPQTHVRFV